MARALTQSDELLNNPSRTTRHSNSILFFCFCYLYQLDSLRILYLDVTGEGGGGGGVVVVVVVVVVVEGTNGLVVVVGM